MKVLTRSVLLLFILSFAGCKGGGASLDWADLEMKAKAGDAVAQQILISTLETNQDSFKRAQAAEILGNADVKSGNSQLLQSLEIDDDNVRSKVVLSLGKLKIDSNLPVLLKVYKTTSEKDVIREHALYALGYFDDEKAVNVLIEELKKGNNTKRVIEALGNTGSAKASQPLLDHMNKGMNTADCAKALTGIKAKTSYSGIVKYLNQKINDYSFDSSFAILAEFMGQEKYAGAQDVLAKGYLYAPENNQELKSLLLKALKNIELSKSYSVVTASKLNMRSEANTRSAVKGMLDVGELSTIIEKTKIKFIIDGKNDYWYKIRNEKGEVGWVFGGYIRVLDKDEVMKEAVAE